MPFWRKRPDSSAPTTPSIPSTRIELIPDRLVVHIYEHDLSTQAGSLPCWTYLTEGLQRLNQPEVSLSLLRQSNTPTPQEPLHFFSMLHQLAHQGRVVHAGDWTQFGARKFFERHLAYVPAQPMAPVPIPATAITAISVTDDELAAIQQFGMLRVIARLGQQARYFPCPPWLDPMRLGISFDQTREHSLLSRLPSIRIPHMRIVQMQQQLSFRLDATTHPQLAEQLAYLPENQPVAFLTELDAEADGCLVWEPDQKEPTAITPPESSGRHICGCFVACVPEQESCGGQVVEDGFVIMLTTKQWQSVRDALRKRQFMEIEATADRLPLRIEWDRR